MMEQIALAAQTNFAALSQNPYPGRGIVAGLDGSGTHLVQIYWIMGRSENSRNRVFKADEDTGLLYTEAADAAKMKDPSLVIYNAMCRKGSHFIVSNGDQTDTVAECSASLYLNAMLQERTYEPDAPNFTQRITAVSSLGKSRPFIQMSILRKSVFGDECDRMLYEYAPHPGFGHCITTYAGDGDPLPAFRGDPLLMPIHGGVEEIARAYWDVLNEEHRVSLAAKLIEVGSGRQDIRIINKYAKVSR